MLLVLAALLRQMDHEEYNLLLINLKVKVNASKNMQLQLKGNTCAVSMKLLFSKAVSQIACLNTATIIPQNSVNLPWVTLRCSGSRATNIFGDTSKQTDCLEF